MIRWKNPSQDDLIRLRAIQIMFGDEFDFTEFLFHPKQPRLSDSSKNLKEAMRSFSSGEQVLILIAMDIWASEGGIHFDDLYRKMSSRSLNHCLKAINYIINKKE